MRLILKLIAAPFALTLSVVAAFLTFVLSASEIIFSIMSVILFFASLPLLFTGETLGGIAYMVIAFLVSPFRLHSIAERLARLIEDAGDSLKDFIFS